MIKFDNEEVQMLIETKLKKTEFTIDDLKSISYISIDGSELNSILSSKDLRLLSNIRFVNYTDIDFRGISFENMEGHTIKFDKCNIENIVCTNSKFTSVEIRNCNFDESIKELLNVDGLEEISITHNADIDMDRIINDYPDFEKISFWDQINIKSKSCYKIPKNLDLALLSNCTNLKTLNLSGIHVNDVNVLQNFEKLESLRYKQCMYVE
ncbi:MAG: hypothetical protein J6A89_07380 [Clostridia bacterium]|nr:hypothetical protein [Clostridia bacterium]